MRDAHGCGLVSRYGYLRPRPAMLMLYNLYGDVWPSAACWGTAVVNHHCSQPYGRSPRHHLSMSMNKPGKRIPHDGLSSLHKVRFDPFWMEQSCHHMIHMDFWWFFNLYVVTKSTVKLKAMVQDTHLCRAMDQGFASFTNGFHANIFVIG